jgi:hypothetical protein
MLTRSKGAKMHRKEEEAMAEGTLAREKEAAERRLQEEEVAAPVASGVALPLVVSPPLALNLNSLLTGHVGQESERAQEDGIASKAMEEDSANNTGKPPKKKELKKSKLSKEGKKYSAIKHDQRGLALKKGSFATVTPAVTTPPANKYKYEQVFYEAGLELKGEEKYGTYIKQIGNLLENIQLVNPTAIMHAAVETDDSKPIGKKEEMNANMTIFLAYALVGKDRKAFKPKKRTRRRGKEAMMNLTPLTPAYILCWSSHWMWTQRPSLPK